MKSPRKPAYHILVVDDETSVSDSIRMVLQHHGHTVQTAENGAAAIALLEPGHFQLVITDYLMHGMNGDELAKTIKLRMPGLPVIMASAYADELKTSDKLDGKVDHLLLKPFSIAELNEAIAHVMG
jgi:CheY-like chemotaxis protein